MRGLFYNFIVSTLKYIVIILLLLIGLAGSVFVVIRVTTFTNKAAGSGSASSVVTQNSYLFASPLQAKADNQEKVRLTVFILDGRGLGVSNKTVSIIKPSLLQLTEIQSITDDTGKAVFDLTSPSSGTYTLEAKVDGSALPQKVRVMFY